MTSCCCCCYFFGACTRAIVFISCGIVHAYAQRLCLLRLSFSCLLSAFHRMPAAQLHVHTTKTQAHSFANFCFCLTIASHIFVRSFSFRFVRLLFTLSLVLFPLPPANIWRMYECVSAVFFFYSLALACSLRHSHSLSLFPFSDSVCLSFFMCDLCKEKATTTTTATAAAASRTLTRKLHQVSSLKRLLILRMWL